MPPVGGVGRRLRLSSQYILRTVQPCQQQIGSPTRDIPSEPRHIYLHVPFCARRCSYCDFSIAVRHSVPVDEHLRALDAELDTRVGSRPPSEVDTIYLGGGTPSRLGGEGVSALTPWSLPCSMPDGRESDR